MRSLSSWLAWQEKLHPNSIDLGLDRIRAVLRSLQFEMPSAPVITIAGTKGKGSCAAMLASMYEAGGYRTGMFTSPHLQRYNERIRIQQQEVSDESLCVAFERIDAARGNISLTYFEFNTLAALLIFSTAALDVWILEVGMGGRLDAVNVMDADVAIVTSIGLDHTEWLGNDIESIAREKAGIFRAQRPALYGSTAMPAAVKQVADKTGAQLLIADRDFGFRADGNRWSWWMRRHDSQWHQQQNQHESLIRHDALPDPGIAGSVQRWNASVALAAVQLLSPRLPVTRQAIDDGLLKTNVAGRFQSITLATTAGVEWILDVAHNPMSAAVLAQHLREHKAHRAIKGKTLAILGMLSDKDVDGTIMALRDEVQEWIAVSLSGTRALTATQVAAHLSACNVKVLFEAENLDSACEFARVHTTTSRYDCVLVCGSFHTVGPVLDWLQSLPQSH